MVGFPTIYEILYRHVWFSEIEREESRGTIFYNFPNSLPPGLMLRVPGQIMQAQTESRVGVVPFCCVRQTGSVSLPYRLSLSLSPLSAESRCTRVCPSSGGGATVRVWLVVRLAILLACTVVVIHLSLPGRRCHC